MQLLEITLSMTLIFGGPGPMTATVDVYPVALIQLDPFTELLPACGMALPHVVLQREGCLYDGDKDPVIEHELTHVRQFEALGPAWFLVYGATGGQALEDYGATYQFWQPPETMRNCPLLRFGSDGSSLLPCYQVWR